MKLRLVQVTRKSFKAIGATHYLTFDFDTESGKPYRIVIDFIKGISKDDVIERLEQLVKGMKD